MPSSEVSHPSDDRQYRKTRTGCVRNGDFLRSDWQNSLHPDLPLIYSNLQAQNKIMFKGSENIAGDRIQGRMPRR